MKSLETIHVAFKARGKENHPDIPQVAVVHLYHHGNFTKCGIELNPQFVISRLYKESVKIKCKKCAGNTMEGREKLNTTS